MPTTVIGMHGKIQHAAEKKNGSGGALPVFFTEKILTN
jgi:hypothetical protein